MEFFIPVIPRTKKNHSQIVRSKGRFFVIPSKQYIKFEEECGDHIPELLIDNKVNIAAVFHMPTRHRVDLVNLQEALCDVLVTYGCIVDDNCNIIHSMDGSYVVYDKENPGIQVTITEITND